MDTAPVSRNMPLLRSGQGASLKDTANNFHGILFQAVKEQVSSQGGNLHKRS
jgi:hypothetical protein